METLIDPKLGLLVPAVAGVTKMIVDFYKMSGKIPKWGLPVLGFLTALAIIFLYDVHHGIPLSGARTAGELLAALAAILGAMGINEIHKMARAPQVEK